MSNGARLCAKRQPRGEQTCCGWSCGHSRAPKARRGSYSFVRTSIICVRGRRDALPYSRPSTFDPRAHCLDRGYGLSSTREWIMAEPVYVIGAGRTDFKRNFKKEGKAIRHIILEASRAALLDAGIDPGEIDAGVVGNFAGGLFTRQLHLGAF